MYREERILEWFLDAYELSLDYKKMSLEEKIDLVADTIHAMVKVQLYLTKSVLPKCQVLSGVVVKPKCS